MIESIVINKKTTSEVEDKGEDVEVSSKKPILNEAVLNEGNEIIIHNIDSDIEENEDEEEKTEKDNIEKNETEEEEIQRLDIQRLENEIMASKVENNEKNSVKLSMSSLRKKKRRIL